MTDAKFCDIHKTGNNQVPRDRTMSIVLQRWDESLGHKVGRKAVMLQVTLDGCNACINDLILDVAKGHGVDIQHAWRIEQLVPPKKGSKSKKWRTLLMTPDEFIEYQAKREKEQEEELERAEQTVPRVTDPRVAPISK